MKKTVIIILIILPIFLLITIAFAGRILALYQHIPVEKVQFIDPLNNVYDPTNPAHTIELEIGDTHQTSIRILPELSSDKEVTYTSSNEEVCMVDEDGLLTGISLGNVVITVTTHDGNKTAIVNVTVKADKVQGVKLPVSTLSLKVGETYILVPKVELDSALDKTVTYISNNEAVVSIDQTGEMEALMPGTAEIIVVTNDGNFSASCTVTVIQGKLPIAFDFTNCPTINKVNDLFVTTENVVNLWDYIVVDEELINIEDVKLTAIGVESGKCTLEDGVLTLLVKGPVTVVAYVGDYENPTYQAKLKITLPLQ